jgi:hypothetical protein
VLPLDTYGKRVLLGIIWDLCETKKHLELIKAHAGAVDKLRQLSAAKDEDVRLSSRGGCHIYIYIYEQRQSPVVLPFCVAHFVVTFVATSCCRHYTASHH